MKKYSLKLLLSIIAITLFIYGCTKGKGDIVIQNFSTEPFTEIEFHIQGELILVTDQNQFVEVHSHQNIINILKIETQSGKLIIKAIPGKKIGSVEELSIYVHTPSVSSVSTHASGNINGENIVVTTQFNVKSTASGNISLSGILCQNLDVKTTASGNIQLNGITDNANLQTSASGNIRSFGLTSNTTIAKTSASGNIETTTLNNLNAKISGSGNIYYKGLPVIISEDSSSGSLINSN